MLFGGLSLVYLPGLVRVFDYHDSFYYFAYTDHANCAAHPQAAYLVFVGRPLFMLINCGVANLMNTVSDAYAIRLIGIAILSACGTAIVGILRAHGVHWLVAVAAVVGLLSVPGWQVVLSMSQAAAVVWSLPPVLGAFFLVRRIVDSETPSGARVRWSFAGAVTLIMVASLTYQQNTAILFSLCAISVVLSPLSRGRRMFLWAVSVYAVSGVLYLAIHRLFVLRHVLPATGASAADFGGMAASVLLSTDVVEKLRFFQLLTPRAFGLWFLDPPIAVPAVVAFIAVAALAALFKHDLVDSRGLRDTRLSWRPSVQRLALVTALVPLSVAPALLAQGGLVVYRHIVAYQWLIVLFVVAAMTRLVVTTRARTALIGVSLMVALVAGSYAHWNFDRNLARINARELEFIQTALADKYRTLPARIIVVQPDVASLGSFGPGTDFVDEFGVTSTMYPQDVPWVVHGAAAEMGLPRELLVSVAAARINPATGRPQVIDAEGKVLHDGPFDDAILIDMREFAAQVRRGEF